MAKSVFCPNAGCLQHSTPDPSLFIKKGKATGYKNKTYQRFLCKVCGTKFSDRKLQWDSPFRKKQHLIQEVFTRYTSGTNINQLRDDLKVNKRSILKIIQFVANKVRIYHHYQISQGFLKSNNLAFDEMEHYIHGRWFPVSIGIAYDGDSEQIVDLGIGNIKAKGAFKAKLVRLYKAQQKKNRKKSKTGKKKKKIPKRVFTRKDTSRAMCEAVLETVQKCAGKNSHITTDEKKVYRTLIKNILPRVKHHEVLSYASRIKKKDPTKRTYIKRKRLTPAQPEHKKALNQLNSVQSFFRGHVPGMARKSQITFKSNAGLLNALYMAVARYNGYDLNTVIKFKVPRKSKKKSARKK